MVKCVFWDLFGDLTYNIKNIDDDDCLISTNYVYIEFAEKIYSLCVIVLLFLSIFIMRKINGSNFFENLKETSIFVLLDDYHQIVYVRKESFESIRKICASKNGDFFNFFNLLECLPCCFFFLQPIYTKLEILIFFPLRSFLWKKSKSICFYMIIFGYYFFSPIEYLTSFLASPCLNNNNNLLNNPPLLIYGIIDLITSTCSFFVLTFMISLISCRREFLSFHQHDIKGKAFFFHYHIKKGLIFAFLGFLVKLLLMIISGKTFFDMSLDAVSNVFWLGRGIFFLLMIRRSHSRKRVQINCNCDYLKEESKFFQIQNFLYKHRLNLPKILNCKDSRNFKENLTEKLEEDVSVKFEMFKKMVNVLDDQKFKNVIIRKNVVDSGNHSILATLFIFYFGMYIILTTMSTLTLTDYRNLSHSCILNSGMLGYNCLDFVEIICFPYLFYKTTRRDNFY